MRNIQWQKYEINKNFLNDRVLHRDALANEEKGILSEILVPSVAEVNNPKEELLVLLQFAAEVEHALLIQYLYAAYSLVDETETVRKLLVKIAIQEMGHLIAVQNLLLCIGGIESVHLHKSLLRANSPNNPLLYTLEPLTKKLLAKFVSVEAPLPSYLPLEIRDEVVAIHDSAKNEVGMINPVGGLYIKIFWLFQKDDSPVSTLMPFALDEDIGLKSGWHIRDEDFLPISEIQKYETGLDVWDKSGAAHSNDIKIASVHGRKDALDLVHKIAVQGEGANIDDDIPSHFESFLDVYRKFDQLNLEIRETAINPVTEFNIEFIRQTEIKNEYSRLWVKLLNDLYVSLLLDIYSSMFYKQFADDLQAQFTGIILSNMHINLRSLSKIIFNLPLLKDGLLEPESGPRAGPAFELANSFHLPSKRDDLDAANRLSIAEISNRIAAIRSHVDYEAHAEQDGTTDTTLSQIGNYCMQKSEIIDFNHFN